MFVHAETLASAGNDVLLPVTFVQRGFLVSGFLFANSLPAGGCPLALSLHAGCLRLAQVHTRARGSDALLHVRGRPLDGPHKEHWFAFGLRSGFDGQRGQIKGEKKEKRKKREKKERKKKRVQKANAMQVVAKVATADERRPMSLCFLLSVLPPFSLLVESSGAFRPKCKGHPLVPPLPFSPPPCRGKGCWQLRAWVLAVASVARQRVLAAEAKGADRCERCVSITRTDESITATLGSGLPSFKSATSLISWNAL